VFHEVPCSRRLCRIGLFRASRAVDLEPRPWAQKCRIYLYGAGLPTSGVHLPQGGTVAGWERSKSGRNGGGRGVRHRRAEGHKGQVSPRTGVTACCVVRMTTQRDGNHFEWLSSRGSIVLPAGTGPVLGSMRTQRLGMEGPITMDRGQTRETELATVVGAR